MRGLVREEDTEDALSELEVVRQRYQRRMLEAIDDYNLVAETGTEREARAAAAKLADDFHVIIEEEFTAAHELGQQIWRGAGKRLQGVTDRLRDNIAREQWRAARFALDAMRGVPQESGRMSIGRRVELYGQSLQAPYQAGALEAAPEGQIVFWRLSATDHCEDCTVLATSSPYLPSELSTLPGESLTICGSACACYLEFQRAEGVAAAEPRLPGDAPERIRTDVEVPPGLRLPTDAERRALRDAELRMAHANRRAQAAHAAGDVAERDRWLGVRSDVNGEIIDLIDSGNIHHAPTFSTSEVLSGVDLRAGTVDNMIHLRGIDGTTLHRAGIEATEQVLQQQQAQFADILRDLPPSAPAVPNFRDLVRQAGAPASAFEARSAGRTASDAFRTCRVREALTTEIDPLLALPTPNDYATMHYLGMGSRATVQAALEAVRVLAESEDPLRVELGPFDDGWLETVAVLGFLARGRVEDLATIGQRLGARLRYPGVVAQPWQVAG